MSVNSIIDWKYKDQEIQGEYFSSVWYESKPKTGVWLLYSNHWKEGLEYAKTWLNDIGNHLLNRKEDA